MTHLESNARLGANGANGSAIAGILLGLPFGCLLLGLAHQEPLRSTPVFRYVEYPLAWAKIVLFFVGLGILVVRFLHTLSQRRACASRLLPAWDGTPIRPEEAAGLLSALERQPEYLQRSLLGQRFYALLMFVFHRRSTQELDSYARSLRDKALTASGTLVSLLQWVIPVLGIVATLLALSPLLGPALTPLGMTTEVVDAFPPLPQVTGMLGEAFYPLALGLGLMVVLVPLHTAVIQLESAMLERVDMEVERQVRYRFLPGDGIGEAVRQQTDTFVKALERLADRQSQLWAEAAAPAVERGLEETLRSHAARLTLAEQNTSTGIERMLEQLRGVASAIRETSREQQATLIRVAESIASQATVLGQLQENENNLIHLQAVLHQNLAALASASDFEQAVHSLTAAAHLLSARVEKYRH